MESNVLVSPESADKTTILGESVEIISAILRIPSGVPTEVPPNFKTSIIDDLKNEPQK